MFDNVQNSELVEAAICGKFQMIADMSFDDIGHYPEQQRFRAIKYIKDSVIKRSPAPKNDPGKPICEETFATEIAALVGISKTMRHSSAYMNWLEACRTLLVYKLYNDGTYMRFTQKWDKGDISLRKGAHKARERIHTQAANKTFKPIFNRAQIEWFNRPKRQDPDPERRTVLNGVSKGNIKNGKRVIELNTHADSSFSKVVSSNCTGHHEKIHDLGFQLGYQYARGKYEILAEQAYDGMLWCYLKQEQAIIPYRIKSAYRSQFHEVVAFEEGNKMSAIVAAMLKPGFNPLMPK